MIRVAYLKNPSFKQDQTGEPIHPHDQERTKEANQRGNEKQIQRKNPLNEGELDRRNGKTQREDVRRFIQIQMRKCTGLLEGATSGENRGGEPGNKTVLSDPRCDSFSLPSFYNKLFIRTLHGGHGNCTNQNPQNR